MFCRKRKEILEGIGLKETEEEHTKALKEHTATLIDNSSRRRLNRNIHGE